MVTTVSANAAAGVDATKTCSSSGSSTGGSGVHVPIGKDGEGEYTASTKGCFDVIKTATPLVLNEIKKQPLRPFGVGSSSSAYHIADYGTADAGTSLGLMTKMVDAVRDRHSNDEKEVVIHYEDQLTNEWQSVFRHALGLKSVTDAYGKPIPNPYTQQNVFIEACGVGFHNQCYPSNSIDFGVSFTAMHWLSQFPSSLKGSEYMHAARCSTPPIPEKEQAASDWKSILKSRAKELVPGGRFVCVNFCKDTKGQFLGQTDVGVSMWDSFQTAWDQLKNDQQLIDEEERLGVSFPNYYRTREEFLSAIEEDDEISSMLKVVSIEEHVVRCPYRELYTSGQSGKTPREYAEWFVPTTKTWSHSTFKSALKSERSEEEKEAIMTQFWENYMSLVEKNPDVHGMDYVHAYIVFEKQME
jgi:SAM-dependent methyltransferase